MSYVLAFIVCAVSCVGASAMTRGHWDYAGVGLMCAAEALAFQAAIREIIASFRRGA